MVENQQRGWEMFYHVKISKLPEFPICGQPRGIVRNFRNSIPEINVFHLFHLIFKQDFRPNFRQMESARSYNSDRNMIEFLHFLDFSHSLALRLVSGFPNMLLPNCN